MNLADMPTRIDLPFATNATSDYVRDIPDTTSTDGAASYDLGFPPLTATPVSAGGIPPDIKDMNGILRAISQWSNWQAAGGAVTYDSAFSTAVGGYPNGAILRSTSVSGKLWRSTTDNNTNNPDVTATGWEPLVNSASLVAGSVNTAALADQGVTNAKLTNGAVNTIKGRSSSGNTTDLTVSQVISMLTAFTGDSGSGGVKGLVPAPAAGNAAAGYVLKAGGAWGTVDNIGLTAGAASTVKGRAATGNTTDLSMTALTAMLNNFVGDSGSGGTKGLVPAPTTGSNAAGQVLKASGAWGAIDLTLQQMSIGSNANGWWFQCGSVLVMWGRAVLGSGASTAYDYPKSFGTVVSGGSVRGWWVCGQRSTFSGSWVAEVSGTPSNSQIVIQNTNVSGSPSGTVNWFVVGDA